MAISLLDTILLDSTVYATTTTDSRGQTTEVNQFPTYYGNAATAILSDGSIFVGVPYYETSAPATAANSLYRCWHLSKSGAVLGTTDIPATTGTNPDPTSVAIALSGNKVLYLVTEDGFAGHDRSMGMIVDCSGSAPSLSSYTTFGSSNCMRYNYGSGGQQTAASHDYDPTSGTVIVGGQSKDSTYRGNGLQVFAAGSTTPTQLTLHMGGATDYFMSLYFNPADKTRCAGVSTDGNVYYINGLPSAPALENVVGAASVFLPLGGGNPYKNNSGFLLDDGDGYWRWYPYNNLATAAAAFANDFQFGQEPPANCSFDKRLVTGITGSGNSGANVWTHRIYIENYASPVPSQDMLELTDSVLVSAGYMDSNDYGQEFYAGAYTIDCEPSTGLIVYASDRLSSTGVGSGYVAHASVVVWLCQTSPDINQSPPLRMNQRNDGIGSTAGHARMLNGINGASSYAHSERIGTANLYDSGTQPF